MADQNRRQQIDKQVKQLKAARQPFESLWKELAKFILPTAIRLDSTKENKGDEYYKEIVDTTATISLRVLAAGMMSGLTSPSRAWFNLALKDSSIQITESGKDWLHQVTVKMREIFAQSNLYNVLSKVYLDIGLAGTSSFAIEEDFEDILRAKHFPVGEYFIAQDYKGRVNTFYREYHMTIEQVVGEFLRDEEGKINWNNASQAVKEKYEKGQDQDKILIGHIVRPNKKYVFGNQLSKKFESLHFEVSSGKTEDKFLKESGFSLFPILAPRWSVYGGDIYGTDCPGMLALPDVKQLQFTENIGLIALEKKVNPPTVASTSIKNQNPTGDAGEVIFEDAGSGSGYRAAYQVNLPLTELNMKQQEIRGRIKDILHENTFKMISNLDRAQITATEIAERKEEKLLVVGPVLEQLNKDLLNPLIDLTFEIMLKKNMIPPIPNELKGKPLQIEYKSIMEQAQKAISIATLERFYNFLLMVTKANPNVLDTVDLDEIVQQVAQDLGIPPTIIFSDDKIAQIRKQKQDAAEAQAQAEMQQQQINAAQQLAAIQTKEGNGLEILTGM